MTTTSYLHRPTVKLTRLSSKNVGSNKPTNTRWAKLLGIRDQQHVHRVSQINLGSLTVEIESAERFRIGERVSIANGETTSIATVLSIEYNDLSKEQRYLFRVEPSTLEKLSDAMSHAPIALVDRRNANRPLSGANISGDAASDKPSGDSHQAA